MKGIFRKSFVHLLRSIPVELPEKHSVVISHDIIMRRLPFTDGKYIMASEHLFSDFRNKDEIMKKIQTVPLSPKTERTMKMKKDTTNKQTEDIHSSPGFSIACGESCDVTVECKLHFFVSM